MSQEPEPVALYCPLTNRIVDIVAPNDTPQAAIARLAPFHGTALTPLPLNVAEQRYEQGFIKEPVETSADRFHEMLEMLPPVGWRLTGNEESFKFLERKAGRITSIFVRIQSRHFEFADDCTLTHAACIERVKLSDAFQNKTQDTPGR